jgi:hypothetical protein
VSTNDIAGYALGGEFNASSLLKLLSYEPPRYKIPAKIKYTGSRKAIRKVLKARKEQSK